MPRLPSLAALLVLLAVLGATLVYPIWLTLHGAFESVGGGLTLYHVLAVFEDSALRAGLGNALAIALGTTVASLVLALPLAMLHARHEFPAKRLLGALVLLPLILPPFVGAIGFQHVLGRTGALNTLLVRLGVIEEGLDFLGRGGIWAIIAIEALHLYPILYLSATAALANVDPALEEAAENLGAGAWRRFRAITLPLIRPGLFAGATIVFVWSFTELGTPLMLDFHVVTPVQIFDGLTRMTISREPYALTVVMLLAAMLVYALGRSAFGRRAAPAAVSRAGVGAAPRRLRPAAAAAAAGGFALVIALATIPHAGVLLGSLAVEGQWYESILPRHLTTAHYAGALAHPLAMGSIRNSLLYAGCAMVLDVGLGLLIAYLLVRTRLPGRGLLDAMAMLPLAVPGLVLAFGYVALTLRWPFGPGDPLHGVVDVIGAEPRPELLLIVAYAVRRLPYVVRAAAAGLEQTPPELEDAALNLGASRVRAVRTITLPLITANLVAGGLLAFSFAMLEVSDSLILAQREADFPITKAIYVLFYRLGDGPYLASAMGVWGMALLALTLVGASMMMGRRLGAVFRV